MAHHRGVPDRSVRIPASSAKKMVAPSWAAASRATAPSVVLVRRIIGRRIENLAALLTASMLRRRIEPSRWQHRGSSTRPTFGSAGSSVA